MHLVATFSLFLTLPLSLAKPTTLNEARSPCLPASQAALQRSKQRFTAAGLVPTYISTFDPTLIPHVIYTLVLNGTNGVGTGTKSVDDGNVFNSIETLVQPTVLLTYERNQPLSTTYSLVFLNFDNPNRNLPPALHVPFLHWQQSGLHACSIVAGNQTQLFIPSFPTEVEEQRYTYLIFREPKGYVADPTLTATRAVPNITELADSQNLKLVGGNYFLEGQENNVPAT